MQFLGSPSEALATNVFDARSLPAHLCASRRLGMFFLRFTRFALHAVARLLTGAIKSMEVGLVGVLSSDPQALDEVEPMAALFNAVDGATYSAIDAQGFSLRLRVAPWVPDPVAEDPATSTRLVLLGRAWSGVRSLTAAKLLDDYLRNGESALFGLGGSFAILIWLPLARRFEVFTDRLGTKKIYFWQGNGIVVFATELLALLAHRQVPVAIDEFAVEQFLITSHLLDNRSLVRDVRLLPAGSVSSVCSAGVASRAYWTPRIEHATDDGLDACADRLAEVLKASVQARCENGPLHLPLSGGLDSRAVAAFIPGGAARAAAACTFGPAYCYDVRYGRRIAKALGARFEHLELPKDFFRSYLGPVQGLCDGEVSIEALPIFRLLSVGEPGQTMLTGYLGDALSGGHLLGLEPGIDNAGARDAIWQRKYRSVGFSEDQLEATLNPERYHHVRGSARHTMETALDSANAPTLDEKALVVELAHRQPRYIAYFGRLLSARHRVEPPFLDADVLDAFLALPLNHRQGQRAYRRMLTRHAPDLAAVPEGKTHRAVTYADRHGVEYAKPRKGPPSSALPTGIQWRLNMVKRRANALLVSASGGWLGRVNRRVYAHHDLNIRRVDPNWYHHALFGSAIANEWFDLRALERMFGEHLSGRYNHATRINNVVALLSWLEKADRGR